MAFVAASYWDLVATFQKADGRSFDAVLQSVAARRLPSSRDFDPATGRLKDPACLLLSEQEAGELLGACRRARPR